MRSPFRWSGNVAHRRRGSTRWIPCDPDRHFSHLVLPEVLMGSAVWTTPRTAVRSLQCTLPMATAEPPPSSLTRPMARVTPLQPPPRAEIELADRRRLFLGELVGRGTAATVYRVMLESSGRVRRTLAVKVFDVVSTDE